MVANKLIEPKEDFGKVDVQVPDCEVMKELLGNHHVENSPNHQKLLQPLLLMLPNKLRRIVNARLLTMPSCSVRKPDVDNSSSSRKAYSRYDDYNASNCTLSFIFFVTAGMMVDQMQLTFHMTFLNTSSRNLCCNSTTHR